MSSFLFFASKTHAFMRTIYILKGELVMTREERKKQRDRARFARYIERTFGNKVWAVVLTFIAGYVTCLTNDATALVFMLFLTVPMFFAHDEWVHIDV